MTTYAEEILDPEDDDGTMVASKDALALAVVGHRIVSAEQGDIPPGPDSWLYDPTPGLLLTLDDGTKVGLIGLDDCCAYTELQEFLLHPELVDHVITGVGTTGEYTSWHIYADMGDVLELTVDWSCGNPFYYAYGFDIEVVPLEGGI